MSKNSNNKRVTFTEVRKALSQSMMLSTDSLDPFKTMIDIANGNPSFFVFGAMSTLRLSASDGSIDEKNIKDAITMLAISLALFNKQSTVNVVNNQEEIKQEEDSGST